MDEKLLQLKEESIKEGEVVAKELDESTNKAIENVLRKNNFALDTNGRLIMNIIFDFKYIDELGKEKICSFLEYKNEYVKGIKSTRENELKEIFYRYSEELESEEAKIVAEFYIEIIGILDWVMIFQNDERISKSFQDIMIMLNRYSFINTLKNAKMDNLINIITLYGIKIRDIFEENKVINVNNIICGESFYNFLDEYLDNGEKRIYILANLILKKEDIYIHKIKKIIKEIKNGMEKEKSNEILDFIAVKIKEMRVSN